MKTLNEEEYEDFFEEKYNSPFKALISVKIKHFEILFGLADVSFKYLKIHLRKNTKKHVFDQFFF